jgi:molecular chaperone GrpE
MEPTAKNKKTVDDTADSETERLKDEVKSEHEMYLRALADFDNYKRRVERERATSARSGKREIILSLLDVLDGFDRALAQMSDAPASVSQGFQSLQRKLLALLEAQGVAPFESRGAVFDPELHEAVGTMESGEYESGSVADEVQRGYRWGDEVLRPARVRVAR